LAVVVVDGFIVVIVVDGLAMVAVVDDGLGTVVVELDAAAVDAVEDDSGVDVDVDELAAVAAGAAVAGVDPPVSPVVVVERVDEQAAAPSPTAAASTSGRTSFAFMADPSATMSGGDTQHDPRTIPPNGRSVPDHRGSHRTPVARVP
jgi:hypothetical protein